MSVESAVERYMRVVRTIGAQRPSEPDHDAFERFKRAAAGAAGVLVGRET